MPSPLSMMCLPELVRSELEAAGEVGTKDAVGIDLATNLRNSSSRGYIAASVSGAVRLSFAR